MSLTELIHFDKDGEPENHGLFRKLFLSLVILLVAVLGFGVGRLTAVGKGEPVRIEYDQSLTQASQTTNTASTIQSLPNGAVVASKSGSKYHFLHCAGAKQIKEENKISFNSAKDAEGAGYTLAANCQPR
jgi:hypothetical protein